MGSVAGLDRPTLEKLCKEAKEKDTKAQNPVCQIANVLFPAGFTCAGTKSTVDLLCQLATKARALQARVIKAGGAFHTPKMQPPRCSIYFNVTGKKVSQGTPPADFIDLM